MTESERETMRAAVVAKREAIAARLAAFVEGARAQVTAFEGAIAALDEMLAELDAGEAAAAEEA